MMTFYRKSSFWNTQDSILYAFIVFGGSFIFSSNPTSFLFSVAFMAFIFGLYFGVNVFVKKKLYSKEIGLELGLDLEERKLQIGSKTIKINSIKTAKFWYIYRIGWKLTLETESKQQLAVISPDVKIIVLELKKVLSESVFS